MSRGHNDGSVFCRSSISLACTAGSTSPIERSWDITSFRSRGLALVVDFVAGPVLPCARVLPARGSLLSIASSGSLSAADRWNMRPPSVGRRDSPRDSSGGGGASEHPHAHRAIRHRASRSARWFEMLITAEPGIAIANLAAVVDEGAKRNQRPKDSTYAIRKGKDSRSFENR